METSSVWDAYLEQDLQDFVDNGSLRDQLIAAQNGVFHKRDSNVSIHDVLEGTYQKERKTERKEKRT
jgi:hypothetical protein